MSDTTPNKWAKLFEQAGVSGQQDLARRTGVSPSTVNRLFHGIGRPDVTTVRAVADVLCAGDTDLIWAIVGTGHFDYGDFPLEQIADELRLLTPKQRQSLMALVRSMADPDGKRGPGNGAPPAKKSVKKVREARLMKRASDQPVPASRRKSAGTPPKEDPPGR